MFKDTRGQVRALFENLEDGATLNGFLAWFAGLTCEQGGGMLDHAEHSLLRVITLVATLLAWCSN